MDTIFWELFNRSIAAGWLILAVMALRLLLRKAPKWLPCTLWAIVAIRLLCPFSFESAFSLIPSAETVNPAAIQYVQKPAIDSGIPAVNEMLNPVVGEAFAPAPGASANPLYMGGFIAGIVWVSGLTVMLGYAFVSCLQIRARVREAAFLRDNIWVCDSVGSPFILGIVRPRIYLSSGMEAEQLRYVLAHEKAHLKRRDHFWKPFGYVLLAVYWFHPLMWAAYLLFCRDIEFACDEKAVRDMNLDGKKAYCRAMLACSMPGKMMVSYPLAFGEGRIKERVKNVLHYRKPALWAVVAAAGICAVTAVCFLTDPETDVVDVQAEEEAAHGGSQQVITEGETEQGDDRDGQDDGETITFDGVIVEHTIESVEPLIMIQPTGDVLPYEYVCFILPAGEEAWAEPINMNSTVSVTCRNSFEETLPAFGELVSISRAGDSPDLQTMFRDFGITIQLPGNGNWIQDRVYRQPDEERIEISYRDAILGADCKLLAVRGESPEQPDIVYDASLEETWVGTAVSGQTVYVRVQRSSDGKQVLATWEYEEYQFAIYAEMPLEGMDIGAVPKVALGVISNLE
ncbi:MAG: M56 family metallopeptidase [Lachnospiraceae bacterium]|nr:M56 family metallopeptidase [Lachnospiraceae bacterium]